MIHFLSYFFPTTVVFVDDNQTALNALKGVVDKTKSIYKFYTNPKAALEDLNGRPSKSQLFDDIADMPLDYTGVYNLYKESYNPDRFNEVSCLVVDFDMPGMNGLELCEKITNPRIKKILLTGAADDQVAIAAFNKKQINFFIRKQDPNVHDLLNQYIDQCQTDFFSDLTASSLEVIQQESKNLDSALKEKEFQDYFTNLLTQHNIIEYYLTDIIGSFLLISNQDDLHTLSVFSEDTLQENNDVIEEAFLENPALTKTLPENFLEDMRNKKATICFPFDGDNINPDPAEWHKYVCELELIPCKIPFYGALAKGVTYLDKSKMTFLNQ